MRNGIACLRRLHGKTGACLVDGKHPVALVTRGVVIMKSGTRSHALWHLVSLISWLAVVCCHGGITKAETVTIVNWPRSDNKVGGNADFFGTRTTENFDYDGDTTADSRRTIRAFSEATRLSPLTTSPAGQTLTFFGGFQSIWVGGASGTPLERAQVRNVTADPITVVTLASPDFPSALQGINVWLASSFLDVDPAADTVAFTAGSQLRMVFSADGTAPTFRFALKQDGQYYLSQAAYAPGTHVLSDPSSATLWATYDPSLDLNFDETAATFSAHSFTDVQAVGVYYGLSQSAVNERVGYRLSEFSATAAVVPEPGSLAGAACGAVAVGFSVRRRRSAR